MVSAGGLLAALSQSREVPMSKGNRWAVRITLKVDLGLLISVALILLRSNGVI